MGFAAVVVVFCLASLGAVVGTRLAEVPKLSHRVLATSGAVLIAISLIWVVPEAASHQGWPAAVLWAGAGFALIWMVDRFVFPICPACSHPHRHEDCSRPLHGFAGPLLIAIAIHSFLDGWSLAVSQQSSDFVKMAFLLGIGIHKIPEGLALGALLRAAMVNHWRSLAACIAAEAMTLVGGAIGFPIAAKMGVTSAGVLLAAAAGTFLYLGYHAIEGGWRRRLT